MLGDFNDYMESDAQGEPAIGDLVGWDQVENVVDRLPAGDRWTHYYDDRDDYKQLDYLLPSTALAAASPGLPEIVRVGLPLRATRHQGERVRGVGEHAPKASDHCPVVLTVRL